ncbi:ATP-binding protein [Lactobacillus amylovorus]|jgi:DNA helicase HerA-like ATPase|uniref:ATP-binding protein n=2 Tax=Lactobacillus amylovorus TaxID=1604 RepID=A0AAW6BBA4_LACAM|nr:ATP-binding protein [Lactobacillus amylovorus]MDA6090160.1 ATP-binding protein [Lactobacillus amylovorus]MDB6247461.1 ATP-binding protein [Lactobacillus amylovorus]UIK34879.1 ATP-binding protein [Lactobacillus amylovorus]
MQDIEYIIGTVKEIRGTSVIIRMFNNSSQLSYFINGERYSGIIIGSYVGIKQGQYVIVGQIEKESAIDNLNDIENITFSKKRFIREFTVKIIGAFNGKKYTQGMVAFPQIFNDVRLLSDTEIAAVISGDSPKDEDSKKYLKIGNIWPNGVNYYLDWTKLFNTHIAIFGNTGSGKSNTLTKLYTELFNLEKEGIINFGKSRFVFLDFNGEYVTDSVLTSSKERIYLDTSVQDNKPEDKIPIPYKNFWDKDLLSTIFGATEQTQQPFLSRIINYYFKKDSKFDENIAHYIAQAFGEVFGSEADQNGLSLLRDILDRLDIKYENCSTWIEKAIVNENSGNYYSTTEVTQWTCVQARNSVKLNWYWNVVEEVLQNEKNMVEQKLKSVNYDLLKNPIFQLGIAVRLQMIHDLSTHMIQYDHIAPLLHRIEARSKDLNKVIRIISDTSKNNIYDMFDKNITVISLKRVNKDIKLLLPMLIARISYQIHKDTNSNNKKTFNLIIDEAHNILSERSAVESEKWKDYRLDVFEEIIKEGRKFGYYLTIASQRPADISPTIVSQVHNYFIHRLVNDLDLKMLQNTMSSLDAVSRNNIPTLSPGQAVITGVSFAQPVIVQIDKLDKKQQPDSSNSNLMKIWNFRE